MKKRNIVILIGGLVVVGIILAISNARVLVVEEVKPEMVVVSQGISSSGRVASLKEADLSFQFGGQIAGINVKEGQQVSAGELLASLYAVGSGADLQAAKSTVDVAKKDLDIYVKNYSTNVKVVGGEDEYWLNVRRLEDLVARAQAGYQSQLSTYQKSFITAPFNGKITNVYKSAGETSSPMEPVLKIAEQELLVFEISIDQEDFGLLKIGQKVNIELDSYPRTLFAGALDTLPSAINPTSLEFQLKIPFIQIEEANILPGMTGDARIQIQTTEEEVQALIFDQVFEESDGTYFVWIKDAEVLKKLPVEIGIEGDIYTEIKTDLSNYTLVTTDDISKLSENTKVRLAK